MIRRPLACLLPCLALAAETAAIPPLASMPLDQPPGPPWMVSTGGDGLTCLVRAAEGGKGRWLRLDDSTAQGAISASVPLPAGRPLTLAITLRPNGSDSEYRISFGRFPATSTRSRCAQLRWKRGELRFAEPPETDGLVKLPAITEHHLSITLSADAGKEQRIAVDAGSGRLELALPADTAIDGMSLATGKSAISGFAVTSFRVGDGP